MSRRHVLIGNGPASVAAAEVIRRCDDGAEIVMVGDEPHGYYSRPGLAYYVANEEPEAMLFPFSAGDFARLDVRLRFERVVRIDRGGHRVTLGSGDQLFYDRVLIATGSTALPANVPGDDLDGVVKLDNLDDARDLIRRSHTARVAVVIGGGITALEIVEGLRARRMHVHYLMRKDRYWSNVLSEAESRMVEDGLRHRGVQIHKHTEIAQILGGGGRVVGVDTKDGAEIPCELVAVALGVRPRKELAEAAGLACDRGILVDEYLRTSDEDIFAAGDVAEARESTTGRRTLEVLWNSAVAKGRVAGLNMATEPTHVYDTGTPLNVTRLAGFDITIIGTVGRGEGADLQGPSRGDSETWSELSEAVVVESDRDDCHVRLAVGKNSIKGAVVIGDQDISFPLHELICRNVDVSDVADELQRPAAPIHDIVRSVWPRRESALV
jgi:NAD(P)H-nitrite reductase large subunit